MQTLWQDCINLVSLPKNNGSWRGACQKILQKYLRQYLEDSIFILWLPEKKKATSRNRCVLLRPQGCYLPTCHENFIKNEE
jgi:hypothetical protein